MRNYDLSYLVERVEIINEARTNIWVKSGMGEFNKQIYSPILNLMKQEDVRSPGHPRAKAIDYLVSSLLDIFDYPEKNFTDYLHKVTRKVRGTRNYSDDFVNWLDGQEPSSQKQMEYSLFTIVKDNLEEIFTPEVKNKLLDVSNIKEYLDALSLLKKKKTGNTTIDATDEDINTPEDIEYFLVNDKKIDGLNDRDLAKKRTKYFLQNRTSISPEDEQYIKKNPRGFLSEDGIDYLDINDLRERVRQNKVEKNTVDSQTPTNVTLGRRIPQNRAAILANKRLQELLGIDRLERDRIYGKAEPLVRAIKKLQRQAAINGSDVSVGDTSSMRQLANVLYYFLKINKNPSAAYSDIDKAIVTNKAITNVLFSDELDDFISDDSNTVDDFIDKMDSYGSKDISMVGKYMTKLAKKPEFKDEDDTDLNQYEGFDQSALKKVLNTDEKMKIFDRWYNVHRKEKQIKETMRQTRGTKIPNRVAKQETDGGISADTQLKINELENRLDELLLDDDTDFDEIERIKNEIQQLKKEKSVKPSVEPEDDVMDDAEDVVDDIEDDVVDDIESDATDEVEDDVVDDSDYTDIEDDIADDEPSVEQETGESLAELDARLTELLMSDDPDVYDEIDRLSNKIAALKQKGLNESSVMSYFTEQVKKDKFSNKVGEFRDRGFKKPKNYHHWLMIND
jgi:hypothetical protein